MSPAEINSKKEMILNIKERILDSCNCKIGMTVNIENFNFSESGKSNSGVKMSISCIFLNEDGNVCADMYRWGAAGCVDFICGRALDSLDENTLKKLIFTLDRNGVLSMNYNSSSKRKKKHLVSILKFPFLKKGA